MFLARLRNAAALLAAVSCASFGILASLAGQPPTPTGSAAQVSVAPEDDAEREAPAIQVDVEVVKRGPWTRIATLFGTVRAADSAQLHAGISGHLKSVRADIGRRVKKGDVLAEIDAPEVLADIAAARAEVERARARIQRSKAAVQVSQTAGELEKAEVEAADAELRAVLAGPSEANAVDAGPGYGRAEWSESGECQGRTRPAR